MSTTCSTSALTFDLLAASDAGTYTCRAILGSVIETTEMMVTVQCKWGTSQSSTRAELNSHRL